MHFDDTSDGLPCVEALWAGTLALMTTYADPRSPAHRELIARKVVSNLFFLARHPGLGGPLRQIVQRAHGRWTAMAGGAASGLPALPVRAGTTLH
jgi:hypothetical protein